MKLYAIRDRLIDYYMTPFPAPNDAHAKASVAHSVNHTESGNAISQAPHHFELYRLAQINEETGEVHADWEFLGGCETFLRPGRPTTEPGTPEPRGTPGRGQATTHSSGNLTRATPGAPQGQTPVRPGPDPETHPGPDRGH